MKEIDLAKLLRARDLKATSTRLEALSIIAGYPKAMPYSKLRDELKDFDRVTLYRTIQALTEHGIIHKAMTAGDDTYYALCGRGCSTLEHDHGHIHFKCTSCNQVSCVFPDEPLNLNISQHIVHNIAIEASGICMSCNKAS